MRFLYFFLSVIVLNLHDYVLREGGRNVWTCLQSSCSQKRDYQLKPVILYLKNINVMVSIVTRWSNACGQAYIDISLNLRY